MKDAPEHIKLEWLKEAPNLNNHIDCNNIRKCSYIV